MSSSEESAEVGLSSEMSSATVFCGGESKEINRRTRLLISKEDFSNGLVLESSKLSSRIGQCPVIGTHTTKMRGRGQCTKW